VCHVNEPYLLVIGTEYVPLALSLFLQRALHLLGRVGQVKNTGADRPTNRIANCRSNRRQRRFLDTMDIRHSVKLEQMDGLLKWSIIKRENHVVRKIRIGEGSV